VCIGEAKNEKKNLIENKRSFSLCKESGFSVRKKQQQKMRFNEAAVLSEGFFFLLIRIKTK